MFVNFSSFLRQARWKKEHISIWHRDVFTLALIGSFVLFTRSKKEAMKRTQSMEGKKIPDFCQWTWWMNLSSVPHMFISSNLCTYFHNECSFRLRFPTHVNKRKFDFTSIPPWQICGLIWNEITTTLYTDFPGKDVHVQGKKWNYTSKIGMYCMRARIHLRFAKHNRFTCLVDF